MKIISLFGIIGISALLMSGCSSTVPSATDKNYECEQDGGDAPSWVCMPKADGMYVDIGVASQSSAGFGFMRKKALAEGRSNLAQQIETDVKDKVENFTRTTGSRDNETVDQVTTSVTKQVAHMTMKGSQAIDSWRSPKGTLFLLVAIPKNSIKEEVKSSIKTSFKNDSALWQEFKSKQALEKLDKEFE